MVRQAHHERDYEPLTLTREGSGDGFALRGDYELDSRFAKMAPSRKDDGGSVSRDKQLYCKKSTA